jgi:hypothetical protein
MKGRGIGRFVNKVKHLANKAGNKFDELDRKLKGSGFGQFIRKARAAGATFKRKLSGGGETKKTSAWNKYVAKYSNMKKLAAEFKAKSRRRRIEDDD